MRRTTVSAGIRAGAALALALCVVGCGESSTTPPVDVVQNYLNDLGAGNFSGACALLDKRTREAPLRSVRPRITCGTVFARCLPDNVIKLTRDQTQLLYASIQLNVTGDTASADVSGTTVARAIRKVTLSNEQGNWKLTSYGHAVRGCHLAKPRHRVSR
ncbi:MAG TPA: hypothetical protein VFI54_27935 [Solirubrobacteraceae bacterium]|nr:hypothetical protein [Solirubrobacteraceae bacterium]